MSTAERVRAYIEKRPAIRDAYRQGIVNYAALARRIADHWGVPPSEAILSACRRYAPSLERSQEETVRQAMHGSRLEVRTRIGLLSFDQGWDRLARIADSLHAIAGPSDRTHLLHGVDSIQLVADEAVLDHLTPVLRQEIVVEERRGLAELNVKSPSDIEEVPGFIAALTGALAERGIRIVDATTCGHDHLLLIESEDLPAAVEALDTMLTVHPRSPNASASAAAAKARPS